jgi:dynein heavy chain
MQVRDLVKKIYGQNFDNVFGYLDSDKDGKVETLDEIRRLLFGYLLSGLGQAQHYAEMTDFEQLTKNCDQALVNYNDVSDAPMDLVLFGFALEHLCRISRILNQPGGHALLVGVGGSGR